MKTLFSNKYVRSGLLILAGLFLGWLFFHSPKTAKENKGTAADAKKDYGLAPCILKSA